MSETKAAFAERTNRSLKNALYLYMKDHGYKYINNISLSVTTLNLHKKNSLDLISNFLKNFDFYPFCRTSHYESLENPKLISETELVSRCVIKPSGSVMSHSLLRKFLQLFQLLPDNHQHTQERKIKMRIFVVNFLKKS